MKLHAQAHAKDCLRTCIACLLGIERDDVPDFSGKEDMWSRLQIWLSSKDLTLLQIHQAASISTPYYATRCILFGDTPSGNSHAVVGSISSCGLETIHDPHPNKPDLKRITAIGFLVPLNYGQKH